MKAGFLLGMGVSFPLFVAVACGGGESKRHVIADQDSGTYDSSTPGAGGKIGAGGNGGTGGGNAAGGIAGASSAGGTGPSVDASAGGDSSDSGVLADASTPHIDASVEGGAGTDSGPDYLPGIDAGSLCPGPVNEVVMTPESQGLPSTGLALWLRADRGIYKTAANQVCAWVDQSPVHAVFLPGTTRPAWAAAGVGAQASVHFGPTNSYVGTPGVLGLAAEQARTFIAVQRITNTTARFQAINMGNFSTPGEFLMIDTNTYQTVGSREGVFLTDNSFDSSLATSTAPRLHVLSIDTMTIGQPVASNIHYRVNSAELTLTRRPVGGANGLFQSFATANFTAIGTGNSTVDVAEVLVYDHALTAPELASVETALTARYQLN